MIEWIRAIVPIYSTYLYSYGGRNGDLLSIINGNFRAWTDRNEIVHQSIR